MPRNIKSKEASPEPKMRYFEGIGRRKTAIARVRFYSGANKNTDSEIDATVNNRPISKYFPLKKNLKTATAPLKILGLNSKITSHIKGGGINAQAEAMRLGLSRAIIAQNEKLAPRLKALGFLTRDSRMVERKKPGLRKARRPQQWRKR